MPGDTFTSSANLPPDYSLAGNWSDGSVPGAGATAVIEGTQATLDPQFLIESNVILSGGAILSGNGGGFSFAGGSSVMILGSDTLYADGAIVSAATVALTGTAALAITVDNGDAQAYGLLIPSFENTGEIAASRGATVSVLGTELSNTGRIILDGGTLNVQGGGADGGQGAAPAGGEIDLRDGAAAAFSGGVTNQNFVFDGGDRLSLGAIGETGSVTITGFDADSRILLPEYNQGLDALQRLSFVDLPDHTAPRLIPLLGGGAEILLEPVPPCFARGTGILTPSGYARVEDIRPGDNVVTLAGTVRPVRWAGLRTLDIAAHRRPDSVRPVRILAGALADGVPARAVRLSPDHALLLRGQLVPAKLLVNGATILRERQCPAVTYYHLELDRHDILLAENLPVESYLDTGNRDMFEHAGGMPRRQSAFGRGRQWDASAYAELCLGGEVLREIRAAIRARAVSLGYSTRTMTDVALWARGRKILAARGGATRPVFELGPVAAGAVTIRSAHFVPAEMAVAPEDEDDNRMLGIAIRRIVLGAKPAAVATIAVSGFHPRAPGDRADWTDGSAVIEVPRDTAVIRLDIVALPQGWLSPWGNPVQAL